MSWIGALAGKAENLLNKVDQAAGQALHKEDGDESESAPSGSQWEPPHKILEAPTNLSPFLSSQKQPPSKTRTQQLTSGAHGVARSAPLQAVTGADATSSGISSLKETDQELFGFLNNATETDTIRRDQHSRPSSTSSTLSARSGKTPELQADADTAGPHHDVFDELRGNGQSSGYHSSQEDGGAAGAQLQHMSSIELENQLLKNEIASLNQEMQSVIQRVQATQEELSQVQRKLDKQSRQLSQSEQIARELQSRESDMQEALRTKDAQLSILRQRFDEADKELDSKKNRISELQADRDRILQDHSSSTGFQSQALDTLQEKLHDAEASLHKEQELHKKTSDESSDRQKRLESEKQNLASEISALQRTLNKEKSHNADAASQLKTARSHAESAKQELADYKDKATRILQSKDKLIASLKDGSGASGSESTVLTTELENTRQERDMLREELQCSRLALENVRAELAEVESQMQQDNDSAQEQINSLESQLKSETMKREDIEQDVGKQKQELRYVHEELLKQKSAFQTRVQDRDNEINRLRNQLTTKTMNATSQEELENRLHSLTESLIQKQTMLEAMGTEKNSLVLQLERMEKQYREAEASAVRASSSTISIPEDDEVRQRTGFMKESPFDGNVTRRVKLAANTIDKFSMRLGVFLRRYPIARVFVIVYMGILHLWVMVVLLTYQPEMHHSDYSPQAPHSIP